MTINLTMIGQLISFVLFVLFCLKFIWPPLTQVMRERQQALQDGLEKAEAAEKQLEAADNAAEIALQEAKTQAAELIAQAGNRATQIVAEAKTQAQEAADRIKAGAHAEIAQEINRSREVLRVEVSQLAIEGAEKILERTVDQNVHQDMLHKIAAQL